ncbi:LORF6 [Gallid alphaherpesvirus 2]|nr:LORF6 [Gallid alphaherpesvirus 2]AQN78174.1 LORF6 [Gallid alphaherpesvirus 2]
MAVSNPYAKTIRRNANDERKHETEDAGLRSGANWFLIPTATTVTSVVSITIFAHSSRITSGLSIICPKYGSCFRSSEQSPDVDLSLNTFAASMGAFDVVLEYFLQFVVACLLSVESVILHSIYMIENMRRNDISSTAAIKYLYKSYTGLKLNSDI